MKEETLLEQMTRVRPEMLNEETLKLFNKIMEVIDERDNFEKYKYKWDCLLQTLLDKFNAEQDTIYLDIVGLMEKIDKGDNK